MGTSGFQVGFEQGKKKITISQRFGRFVQTKVLRGEIIFVAVEAELTVTS
jgi:hypothetical protein